MKQSAQKVSGVALLAVLWVVAALSLFVASLGKTVRSEAALTSVSRDLVQGRAYGEAAIYQILTKIKQEGKNPEQTMTLQQSWQGIPIEVQITPWSGLVNINGAGLDVLTMLLQKTESVPMQQAQQIAQNIVDTRAKWREKNMPWEAVEDILQVPGIDYSIFESLMPYLVAEKELRGGINFLASPQPLSQWLQESGLGISQNASSRFIRLLAKVPFEEGYVAVERDYWVQPSVIGDGAWKLLASSQRWHKNQ